MARLKLPFKETKAMEQDSTIKQSVEDVLRGKRIAWYPYAGNNFNIVLYLSEQYKSHYPPNEGCVDSDLPNVFLLTDHNPPVEDNILFKVNETIVNDGRTTIIINSITELNPLQTEMHEQIFNNMCENECFNRAYVLDLNVKSNELGDFGNVKLVYCVAGNEDFAKKILIENKFTVSHIYLAHARSGSNSNGSYLTKLMTTLKTEMFIATDINISANDGDCFFEELCNEAIQPIPTTRIIRESKIDERYETSYKWYQVKKE